MHTKTISYSLKTTINMGDYESVQIQYGEELGIDKNDEIAEIKKKLIRRVTNTVEEQILPLRKIAKKRKA